MASLLWEKQWSHNSWSTAGNIVSLLSGEILYIYRNVQKIAIIFNLFLPIIDQSDILYNPHISPIPCLDIKTVEISV